MDFLVRVDASRAYDLPADDRKDVIEQERVRGRELMAEGVLRHFWRLPGKRANIGVWTVADADALEEVLDSLPIRPYADIDVTPLATHPMVAAAKAAHP
ncbi:muconolactone Delta-isomerase [Streptantibioticus ferralitis]|uniref:Muconolactone Delta-isomerase n=1 Tax=Streptantibioticus ferralitis TaxID=236510 RepID=A0ABT5Z153_9ACTN|nr:muconolactone Delta-isomerase family protein [Streptantibioticus ferralitis]MDF2257562.1 muconolactone Delta-isomerase family protein [Streptantibioticus ferralitis]